MTHFEGISDCVSWWAVMEQEAQAGGDLMFDIGANGGVVSRMFAKRFKQVVAIEPAQESYSHLSHSVPVNVHHAMLAASDHVGELRLRIAEESIATGQLVDGDSLGWGSTLGTRLVPCTTLDELMFEWGVPNVVKIDVEGHEMAVLNGAANLLDENVRWLIEIHSVELGEEIAMLLSTYGYRLEEHRHTGYVAGSENWKMHFYLHASRD